MNTLKRAILLIAKDQLESYEAAFKHWRALDNAVAILRGHEAERKAVERARSETLKEIQILADKVVSHGYTFKQLRNAIKEML